MTNSTDLRQTDPSQCLFRSVCPNQLLQLCTARTAWSKSDQAVQAVHSCNNWWLGPLWSDLVIKLVSVLFGKCTPLVVTKCWPMETRLPCGDQWKAEKLGAFWRWPITWYFIKSDSAGLFIEHSINFRLDGEHWRPCNYKNFKVSSPFWAVLSVPTFLLQYILLLR